MSNDNNSLPELLELLVRVVTAGTKNKVANLHTDLRIARTELECPDGLSFTVGLKRVWLSLDVTGLSLMPASRFGEPIRPNETSIKQKIAIETADERELKFGAGGRVTANPSASADAKYATKKKTKSSTTTSVALIHTKVKARPNLRWEITESQNLDDLDGTYLNDDVLCRSNILTGANSKTVQLAAYARQKDITFEITKGKGIFSWPSTNHEKMLKVLISKALAGIDSPYSGVVALSCSEVEVED